MIAASEQRHAYHALGALAAASDACLLVATDEGIVHGSLADVESQLRIGGRLVVAVAPEAAGSGAVAGLLASLGIAIGAPIASASANDPLVEDRTAQADGVGPLAGLRVTVHGASRLTGGTPLLAVGNRPVAVQTGNAVIVGTASLMQDRWLAAPAAAMAVAWMLTGRHERPLATVASSQVPGDVMSRHRPPAVVIAEPGAFGSWLEAVPGRDVGETMFVKAAGRAARLLPPAVHDALVDFSDEPGPAGALLVRGVPVGDVPATPPTPTCPTAKDQVSEFALLTAARRLGQPVGYAPEHGGDLVQNLVPVRAESQRQLSTSSSVTLQFHTETAFHPHKPRYLLLLCLRGDPAGKAHTLLASVREVVERLPLGVRRLLHEPRFRTGVDESFAHRRSAALGRAAPVLTGSWEEPYLTFDADLMVGTDTAADEALRALGEAIEQCHTAVALETGDLLVVDNLVAVHGRSPFTARFDGTDRWLQRTFVVADLAASVADRRGRIVRTQFAS